jgi:GH25 family lysozyme M1 (1,4-beta-N-acetylmuramidase)
MHHRSSRLTVALAAAVAVAVAVPVALMAPPAVSATNRYDGPDVASYQHPHPTKAHPHGQPINWKKVRKAGMDFAIVKATEGSTYTNPYFDGPYFHDYAAAASAGLVHGAYHFARPGFPIVNSARSQAKFFAHVVGPVKTANTLPPALDLESTGGLDPAQLVTWAQAFELEMRKITGRTPILYTYPNFWTSDLANPAALARYPLWMAAYGVSRAPDADLWQYTSTAHVSGITGDVDLSKFIGSDELPWSTLSDGTVKTPWKAASPGKPQAATAAIDGTTATVRWSPGDSGTKRIAKYVVTASPGGMTKTVHGTTFGAVFSGLTPATSYTFTVAAVNAVGKGNASAPTNPVIPTVPTVLHATVGEQLAYGDTLPVRVKLTRTDTKAALSGRRVLIFRRHSASENWKQIAKLHTNAHGKVHTVLTPKASAQLEAVFPGAKGVARSTVFSSYTVTPIVATALSAPTVKHGKTVTLSGSVHPFVMGEQVARQRKVDGTWVTKGTTAVTKDGTYSFTLTPRLVGTYVYRLVAASTAHRGTGYSRSVRLTAT